MYCLQTEPAQKQYRCKHILQVKALFVSVWSCFHPIRKETQSSQIVWIAICHSTCQHNPFHLVITDEYITKLAKKADSWMILFALQLVSHLWQLLIQWNHFFYWNTDKCTLSNTVLGKLWNASVLMNIQGRFPNQTKIWLLLLTFAANVEVINPESHVKESHFGHCDLWLLPKIVIHFHLGWQAGSYLFLC